MEETTLNKTNAAVMPYAWVILAVVYLASIVAPFNLSKVPPIIPVIMSELNMNLTQAGLLMSAVAMAGLILALPAGILLRRYGSKIIGLVALGCLAAGSVIGALSNSYAMLLGSRVIEGMGLGLIGVAAPATVAMWFPPERRGMPMGIWSTWMPVGGVLMTNLAPSLASAYGWRSVWWVGAGFALLVLILYAVLVHNPDDQPVLSQKEDLAALRIALSNRDIWLLAGSFLCFNLGLASLFTYYPTFLNRTLNYSLGLAAFIASLASLVVIAASPLSGWISDRVGSRKLFFSLPYLAIAVMMALPFNLSGWQIIVFMVVLGVLIAAIPTSTFAAAPELMRKPEWAGMGLAALLIGQNLGNLIGPALFAGSVGRFGWTISGYFLIPVGLVGFLLARRVQIR